jgi:hypothetical protein
MTVLITSSLQPSSKPTYHRAWKLFELFHHSVFPRLTKMHAKAPICDMYVPAVIQVKVSKTA